ncbi:MAG: hypothetical protein HC905_18030 [Bacteroidales bacterium]|nr:hypothetical protein [Bacteroidales bacterium]
MEKNLNSALNITLQMPEILQVDTAQYLDLYQDSTDMVAISKKRWGGYLIIKTMARWRVIEKSKHTLCGAEILPKDAVALYLADEGKYLSIAGNTMIKGNVYLPKLGVRKGYIEGKGFSGTK